MNVMSTVQVQNISTKTVLKQGASFNSFSRVTWCCIKADSVDIADNTPVKTASINAADMALPVPSESFGTHIIIIIIIFYSYTPVHKQITNQL